MRRRPIFLLVLVALIGATYFFVRQAILDAWSGTAPIRISSGPAPVTFERAFPNLVFQRPVYLTYLPDGSGRVAVLTQYGELFFFPNNPDIEEATQVLSIRDKLMYKDGSNEEGLLGLAFHPDFGRNRQFFLYYTALDHRNTLARFEISTDDPNRADPASELEILRSPEKPAWHHNAGTIVFGPDGFLYIAVGDGALLNDPQGHGQSLNTILAKVLRIDVDHQDPGLKYSIPKDNPFVDVSGARGEIWAYGLRNIWRMAFDRQTGRLWAGDVGQDNWEEINIVERGGNYGWSAREGFRAFKPATHVASAPASSPTAGKLREPIFAYNHSVGNCIVGGCVYRGKRIPELTGAYLFADHVTGQVYALRYDKKSSRAMSVEPVEPRAMPVLSFGEDESEEIYIITTQGIIHRLVAAGETKQK